MSNGTSSWNRPHESVKSEAGRAKKAPSAIRGIVAGLVVVALAAVCVFIFMGKDEKPTEKTEKKSGRIKEVTPAFDVKTEVKQSLTTTEKTKSTGEYPYKEWLGKKVVGYKCTTNETVGVITEKLITEDGKTHSIDSNLKKNPFSAADNRILLAIGTDPTRMMPPAPMARMSDAAARKDLEKEISILSTDTPAEREQKEKLISIRREILARMDEGESFDDIIRSHRENLKETTELKRDVQKEINELDAAGHRDEAFELAEVINKKLDEYGASHVQVPLSTAEKDTIRQELLKKYKGTDNKENP